MHVEEQDTVSACAFVLSYCIAVIFCKSTDQNYFLYTGIHGIEGHLYLYVNTVYTY